jgi:hypothetical protein
MQVYGAVYKQGRTLVNALAESFDPSKYRDTYREGLEALIADQVEGRQTATVTAAPHAKPVADIMKTLRKSLEAFKKPAGKAEAPRGRAVKQTGQSNGNSGRMCACIGYQVSQATQTPIFHRGNICKSEPRNR